MGSFQTWRMQWARSVTFTFNVLPQFTSGFAVFPQGSVLSLDEDSGIFWRKKYSEPKVTEPALNKIGTYFLFRLFEAEPKS